MKKLTLIILLILYNTISFAQLSINIGTDPKILFKGTDNQYATHKATANTEFKLEYYKEKYNTYLAVGYKYVNLSQTYEGYYINIGQKYQIGYSDFYWIPKFEAGVIKRELVKVNERDNRHSPLYLYIGLNNSIRYKLNNTFELDTQGYVNLATDLPNRTFRYGGTISLIITLIYI